MPLASWPARLFVVGFTLAIAICGALSIEAWPLTGWRLFSHERRQITTSWTATSVDKRGRETPIPFGRFDAADGHFINIMSGYRSLSPQKQEATCQAWARLVREHGGDARGGLRLYLTIRDMRRHVGRDEPVVPQRELRWTCAGGRGVRAITPGAPGKPAGRGAVASTTR